MKRVNSDLAPNEKMVFTGIPDWTFLLRFIVGFVVGVIAFVAVLILAPDFWWAGAIFLAVTAVPLAFGEIRRRSNHFILTTERLRDVEGVIARHAVDIPLDRIMNISHKQSLLGRMINSGTLYIESAGMRGKLEAEHTAEPSKLQALINKQVEAYNPHGPSEPVTLESIEAGSKRHHRKSKKRSRPAGSVSEPTRAHNVDQTLSDLSILHDQQIFSDEEFAQKKRALLRRS